MNNQLSIDVTSPCKENFDSFLPTGQGGFCKSCDKEVIDFSKMSSDKIIQYFQNNQSRNTCGRFKSNQLNTVLVSNQVRKNGLLKRLGLALIAVFSFSKMEGQNLQKQALVLDSSSSKVINTLNEESILIKGTVKEGKYPLPDVNIHLEGTTIGTTTDFDGNFEFPQKLKKGDVLVFSYIGMNSKKVEINHESNEISVTMDMDVNLELDEVIIVGKVATKGIFKSKKD